VRALRRPNGALRVEQRTAGAATVIELKGGDPIVAATGDTVGTAYAMPRVGGGEHDLVRQFGTRVDRRLILAVVVLLGAAGVIALLVTGRLLGPLHRFRRAAEHVAAGDYATRIGVAGVAELEPLAHAFDRMAESLQRSEGARRQMIRDVAHELRTPITNLRGQLEALQDRLREPTPEAIASLHEEAALLARLVADLDELAHADSGHLDVHVSDVELLPEVTRALDGFVRGGQIDADRVHVQVAPDARVVADRERLGQILRNLVQNAVQHGGDDVRISVVASSARDGMEIAVRDTGRGIAAEHLPRVFDRLYRTDPSRTRETGGAGLGLAIVKALVEAQGGTVRIESVVGAGTTVTLTLPAGPPRK
jgi:signal transduction histidine kinase